MSVYTTVTPEELAGWLTRYAIGAVHEFEPIAAGIENTNYFVTADKGRFVLTLYERLPAEELPFYLNLMAHLANAGVQAPAPEPDRSGALWSILNGKPAGLVARLDGAAVVRPGPEHCAAAGAVLARMHIAASSYRSRLSNRRGPGWWRQAARTVRPFLSTEQNALIASELKFQARLGRDI
jgi:homoserine kinase type II